MKYSRRILVIIVLNWLCLSVGLAQQTSSAPSQTPEPPSAPAQQSKEPERPLGVLPQFGVTYQHDAPPLRPAQKFRVWWRTATDPATIVIAGVEAGVGQA